MIRTLLAGSILLFLTACAPAVRVVPAKPVIVTRTQYVPIPAQFLAPCNKATTEAEALRTNGSLLAAWQHDSTALTACAAQIDGIRALK